MRKSRFTEEQIIEVLRLHAAGAKASEVCRQRGISGTTLYKWKAKYGGMTVRDARRLEQLVEENRRLKKLLAEIGVPPSPRPSRSRRPAVRRPSLRSWPIPTSSRPWPKPTIAGRAC